jgi:hypothetical protein
MKGGGGAEKVETKKIIFGQGRVLQRSKKSKQGSGFMNNYLEPLLLQITLNDNRDALIFFE